MPGFWLINLFTTPVEGYATPIYFTATAMIGMIALAGIVVRNSIKSHLFNSGFSGVRFYDDCA